MKRNIQELLSIKFEELFANAEPISTQSYEMEGHYKALLLKMKLKNPFQNLFTEMRIRCFNDVATHLMFNSYTAPKSKLYPLLQSFVEEYGPDQNGLVTEDWKGKSHYSLGWGFSNKFHEPAYDNPEYRGDWYYAFDLRKPGDGTIELAISSYNKIDESFVKLNDKIIKVAKAKL